MFSPIYFIDRTLHDSNSAKLFQTAQFAHIDVVHRLIQSHPIGVEGIIMVGAKALRLWLVIIFDDLLSNLEMIIELLKISLWLSAWTD